MSRTTSGATSHTDSVSRPPLLDMVLPLLEELGEDMFCLVLARASHSESGDDPWPLPGDADGDFAVGFGAWSEAATSDGWGTFELTEFERERVRAQVVVREPWELALQTALPPERWWGCPLLKGKLAALFSRVFGVNCWARESWFADAGKPGVEFTIHKSHKSLDSEIEALRNGVKGERERQLVSEVGRRSVELEEARRDLENRSRDLLRERMRSLREEILERERAERFKDELIATVSHELRTPLASLRGFSELLLSRDLSEDKRRHYVEIIHGESVRLGKLVDGFLDLQRLEAGAEVFELERLDLAPLLRQCADLFSGGTHTVVVDTPLELPEVLADADRVRQVVTNLLSNAIKFSPGAHAVDLSASVEREDLVIGVRDHGVGIPAEAQSRLFERFYRVDNAETRSAGGTGLGLAIVKELVEEHGGRIEVESKAGEGSTFRVLFPLPSPRDV